MKLQPSKSVLKEMGFNNDQEGILRRFVNEEGNWSEHLSNTKKFISRFINDNGAKSIAVLGSGWLLDIPVKFLAENCKNIYLYDIRHPRQVVHKLKQYQNISCISTDLTGGAIEEVYKLMKGKGNVPEQMAEIGSNGFFIQESVDCVISVNILNQLDILLMDYLKRFPAFDKNIGQKFKKNIQSAHIRSLKKVKSAIITDFEEVIFDRTGKFIQKNNLLCTDLPETVYSEEWQWNFDTKMTYYPNRKTFLNVKALKL